MTDPHKNAAPEAPAAASVEQPATGDASPNARPTRVASPVVTVRPSASPVAQMVQSHAANPATLHVMWLETVESWDEELRYLARCIPSARVTQRIAEAEAYRAAAAARAYSYAVQAERTEKAGDPLADARRELAAEAIKRRGGGFRP